MPHIRQFFSSYFAVIDRYILKEFILNLFAVTTVLWLIYVATRFARYLAQAAVGNLPSEVIFSLLGYSSLAGLSVLLPMGTFLAVMLALSRMSSDNELTVIFACGIPHKRVVRNVLIFSGAMAIIIAVLSLVIVPNAMTGRYELEQKAKMSADTSGLIAGKFKESRNGDWTFYSEGMTEDKQKMLNVFIEIHKSDKPLVFRAAQGSFEIDSETGNKYLVLFDGYRYEGKAGEQDFTIAQYESHSLLIEEGKETQLRERHKALASKVLWQRGGNADIAELQWRVSTAVMTVVLSLFAMSLANAGPRKGRYASLFPAILTYIIYSNLLGVSRAWIMKGTLNPVLGSLWVHMVMLIILAAILNRNKIHRYWLQSRGEKKVARQ